SCPFSRRLPRRYGGAGESGHVSPSRANVPQVLNRGRLQHVSTLLPGQDTRDCNPMVVAMRLQVSRGSVEITVTILSVLSSLRVYWPPERKFRQPVMLSDFDGDVPQPPIAARAIRSMGRRILMLGL